MANEAYFSIVIPMYNQEKYIARCLDSIVTQSMFEQLEVIIVDDGSEDFGSKIVRKYIAEHGDRIRLITQTNKGPGGARNTGVRYAVGRYIWFIDADDVMGNEAIVSLYNKVQLEEPEIVIFDMDEVDADGKFILHAHTYDERNDGKIFSPTEHKDILGSIHSAGNRIILREFYQKVQINFPDRLYFEDLMTIPKLLCCAERIKYIQSSYYHYFHNAGSIMRSKNVDKYKDIITVMDNLLSFFTDRGLLDVYRDELEYMIIFHAYLMVSARIIKQDYKSKILRDIKDYIGQKWSRYHENKYIKRLNIKYKLSLRCMDKGVYLPIYYALNMKGQ